MIELQHISKTFNRQSTDPVQALKEISLTISPADFISVIGPNGSGKSTLLNVIAGTVTADAGRILIDGVDISSHSDFERSRWVSRVFQNPMTGTAPELSILENFRLARLRSKPKKLVIGTGDAFKHEVQEKLSLLNLGLENKIIQPVGTLSGGQRQALTLLMAVMDETKILLMDEPTAALDPKTSGLLMQLAERIIFEFRLTVFFVTHQMKDALRYGNRVLMMEEGRITRDVLHKEKLKLHLDEIHQWFS